MRTVLTALFLLMTNQAFAVSETSDRAALHADRIGGLALTSRTGDAVRDLPAAASAVGNDWQISQSVAPARFDQDRSEVVPLANGGWRTVWSDDRQGSWKIFAQSYDALGNKVGSNEMIAGSLNGDDFVDPVYASDALGRIYLGYRNQTQGTIRVTRFAADGTQEWEPRLVNDTTLASFAGPFDLAVFPDGQLVVVWENYSALGSTIAMRLYTPTGADLLGPTAVNSDGGSANHWVPSIAVAPGSGFLVVWEDYRNGRADIYARQFTGAGVAVGADLAVVPSPMNEASQYMPTVTYSVDDRYVVGWEDHREGQEIYLQRFDQASGLVGGNRLVSSGLAEVLNRDVNLSSFADGRVSLFWSASGADNSIQYLELDSGLVPGGLPQVINTATLGQRWAPASSSNSASNLAVVWSDVAEDNSDIALMIFDSDGDPILAQQAKVNDDALGAHSTAPEIVPTSNWYNLVGFVDKRRDQGDIMVRNISVAGNLAGDEIRVNQDIGAALQSEPSLATSDTRALMVWNDGRTLDGFSGQRIFGRYLTLFGAAGGNEFLISAGQSQAVKASPRAALFADGSGLVAWLDRRSGAPQVYLRWLAITGGPDGDEILISTPGVDLAVQCLYVGRDDSRIFLVWLDVGRPTPTVEVRAFTAAKTETVSYSFVPSGTPAHFDRMAADISPDGSVGIFWVGDESGTRKGFLSYLADDGSVVTDSDPVVAAAGANPSEPSLSICNNGYFSLTWIDRRGGSPAAFYQILDPAFSIVVAPGPVSTANPEFMQNPHTDAYRGRAWFVWSDPRADGLNVFADQVVYLATDVDDDPASLPTGYRLAQNYPNPFNPTTEIEYSLPEAGMVCLDVMNILGQTVTTLVDGWQPPGSYVARWDGQNSSGEAVASGVYLYRLRAGEYTSTRKMMLLK